MKRMVLGTGVYEDFPTDKGNIYPKEVLSRLLNDPKLRERIARGELKGGLLDPTTINPAAGIVTHKVVDLRLFNGELVAEVELFDDQPEVALMLASLKHPHAAIIIETPEKIRDGQTIRRVNGITTVHLREHKLYGGRNVESQ